MYSTVYKTRMKRTPSKSSEAKLFVEKVSSRALRFPNWLVLKLVPEQPMSILWYTCAFGLEYDFCALPQSYNVHHEAQVTFYFLDHFSTPTAKVPRVTTAVRHDPSDLPSWPPSPAVAPWIPTKWWETLEEPKVDRRKKSMKMIFTTKNRKTKTCKNHPVEFWAICLVWLLSTYNHPVDFKKKRGAPGNGAVEKEDLPTCHLQKEQKKTRTACYFCCVYSEIFQKNTKLKYIQRYDM